MSLFSNHSSYFFKFRYINRSETPAAIKWNAVEEEKESSLSSPTVPTRAFLELKCLYENCLKNIMLKKNEEENESDENTEEQTMEEGKKDEVIVTTPSLLTRDEIAIIQQNVIEDQILRNEFTDTTAANVVSIKKMNELFNQWESTERQFNNAVLPCFRALRDGTKKYNEQWSRERSKGLIRLTDSMLFDCFFFLLLLFLINLLLET
jgi:hypothetical protein